MSFTPFRLRGMPRQGFVTSPAGGLGCYAVIGRWILDLCGWRRRQAASPSSAASLMRGGGDIHLRISNQRFDVEEREREKRKKKKRKRKQGLGLGRWLLCNVRRTMK